MQCDKCGRELFYVENDRMWQCPKCRTFFKPSEPGILDFKKKNIKKAAAACGFLFAAIPLPLMYMIAEGDIFFWPTFTAIFLLWGMVLPVSGAVLILMDRFKVGGLVLVAGSVLFIPLGLVGVHYGLQAVELSKTLRKNREFRDRGY
ncbi:MAG: hypothetical protein KKH41_06495 [Candidatus Thermoplasmatota archaeon]|nr:hypothetical protein [Euryarchaeota archaeon]MBU4032148.1 hypothetical protein [Candidatus Thermoplasmatota archaeon]MBU4071312.1 hypothetical protein [Candidatus Thermoplasmatota archaeon]MBU4143393.1 hypothetical protein [Candidatus Thermoplasmatota archaeon]MBU4592216.1 hypothetical protein [Candidatus Thermoplasmatota archaeon]